MGLSGIVSTEELKARFEAKVRKTDGCWYWMASLAGKGYGQFRIPGTRRNAYAHRIAYLLWKGEIPPGKYVCHTCDEPTCVNPDHLWLGSCAENQADMASKDRSTHGARNSQAKLDDEKVRQIRACLQAGLTQKQIAKAFGVSQIQISRIKTGQRWSRVR